MVECGKKESIMDQLTEHELVGAGPFLPNTPAGAGGLEVI